MTLLTGADRAMGEGQVAGLYWRGKETMRFLCGNGKSKIVNFVMNKVVENQELLDIEVER